MRGLRLVTVVELPIFLKQVESVLDQAGKDSLLSHIAANPEAGDEIPRTGGLRKLRWGIPGKGKRGGARVIYYFYNDRAPVFMLSIYGKSEKETLSPDEEKKLSKLASLLKEECRKKRS